MLENAQVLNIFIGFRILYISILFAFEVTKQHITIKY